MASFSARTGNEGRGDDAVLPPRRAPSWSDSCRSRHAGSPCCPRMCAPKAGCSRPAPVGAVPILLLAPAARCTQGCERCSLPQLARFGSFHLSYHSWDGKGQSPAPGCITVAIPPLSWRTGWLGRAAAFSPRAAIVFPARKVGHRVLAGLLVGRRHCATREQRLCVRARHSCGPRSVMGTDLCAAGGRLQGLAASQLCIWVYFWDRKRGAGLQQQEQSVS